MNYHRWIIVDINECEANADPWKHIANETKWLADTYGHPERGPNCVVRDTGVWRITVHFVEQYKLHYRISFKNEEDAALFRMTWQ